MRVLKLLRIVIDGVVFMFHSDRILCRFLIDRILLRIHSDRVFFKSSGFSSGSADSSLGSSMLLFHHVAIFYQIVLLLFFNQKHTFCFTIIISSKTISLTYFNNFDQTGSEKNIIKIKNEKKYVENICHQFPDL